jgi:AraC-like DNA-binding protein
MAGSAVEDRGAGRTASLGPRLGPRGLMVVAERRVVYRGRLPNPIQRCLGGYSIYVALDRPFRFRRGAGPWQEAELAVAGPYEEHSFCSGSGYIVQFLIEEEDVSRACLPEWMRQTTGPVDCPQLAARLREACASIQAGDGDGFLSYLDILFFGGPLPQRRLDPRVARVVADITALPGESRSAEDCARSVGLSLSRFLHLFKAEVGTPFRRMRAWKRAREVLNLAASSGNLTEIALDSGYADSSHFSHSIRDAFGSCPREIVVGLRRMPAHRCIRGREGNPGAKLAHSDAEFSSKHWQARLPARG